MPRGLAPPRHVTGFLGQIYERGERRRIAWKLAPGVANIDVVQVLNGACDDWPRTRIIGWASRARREGSA